MMQDEEEWVHMTKEEFENVKAKEYERGYDAAIKDMERNDKE